MSNETSLMNSNGNLKIPKEMVVRILIWVASAIGVAWGAGSGYATIKGQISNDETRIANVEQGQQEARQEMLRMEDKIDALLEADGVAYKEKR
jgi:hypothetical protein